MQFLFFILINIVLGAVFYLIISLKLEKSAAQFQEKKLRKEMDDIIKEFNAAAERNISLLERRIDTLKRLLQQTGDLKGFDARIGDEIYSVESRSDEYQSEPPSKRTEEIPAATMSAVKSDEESGIFESAKKSLHFLARESRKIFQRDNAEKNKHDGIIDTDKSVPEIKGSQFDVLLEKDLSNITLDKVEEVDKDTGLSGDEIQRMFDSADDRYSVITELYRQGYEVEVLSQYSGVPEGEIKLVLNLSR